MTRRQTALTSVVTGKTFEGFQIDRYPNRLVSFSVEEQIDIALGIGGRLPVDWIPRPNQTDDLRGISEDSNHEKSILSPF